MASPNSKSRDIMRALAAALMVWLTATTQAASFGTGVSMLTARDSHTATLLPNGKMLVTGGRGVSTNVASAELYEPGTGAWTLTASLNTPRSAHTATLLNNGKVLVTGGFTGTEVSSSTELYDPGTSAWALAAPLNVGRMKHTATRLLNGMVLIAGGMLANETPIADAEIYDPVSAICIPTGTMNNARNRHSATLLPNGMVLVVGGLSNAPLDSAELFNPNSGAWTPAASPKQARIDHTATLLPNGNVLIVGGASRTANLSLAQLYDPISDSWAMAGVLTTARSFHTATLLPDGTVLVAGGYQSSGGGIFPVAAERWQPESGAWIPAGNMVGGREWHTAVLLANGKVLLAGGYNSYTRPRTLSAAELYFDDAFGPKTTLTDAARLPGGTFQIAFTNLPGSINTILAATNPASPLSTWTAAGAASEVSPGQFKFTDLQATNFAQRFYRVRTPY